MGVLNVIWKISSLIIAGFLIFELLVISPILLLLFLVYRVSVFMAPDVFSFETFSALYSSSKYRKVLLCVDPTSVPSVNWVTRDFPVGQCDQVLVVHVIEPTESIQIPGNCVKFNPSNIDTKDFVIPQYISEICHWLHRSHIDYEGIILRPLPKCNVAETILKVAQKYSVDCIIASASERTGT